MECLLNCRRLVLVAHSRFCVVGGGECPKSAAKFGVDFVRHVKAWVSHLVRTHGSAVV